MEALQDDAAARLRIWHQLHKEAMGSELIKVPQLPKDQPIKILDSATEDGRWMAEVAVDYPNAQLLGTIIPEQFEQLRSLPSRISFRIQSVLTP